MRSTHDRRSSLRTRRPDDTPLLPQQAESSSLKPAGTNSLDIRLSGGGETVAETRTYELPESDEAATFAERAEIYTGATNVQSGGTETVDGVETKILTFYLLSKTGQSGAWFAWWVDPDTGNLLRLAMIAKMHFMVWNLTDINERFTIEPSPVSAVATPLPSDPQGPAGVSGQLSR
ncbi:MAG TPA: hypothetical protein VGR22_12170 [Thermomicrobiales bacterium]|nr:hypothetical protein [Thermomicrobiales bacterium]